MSFFKNKWFVFVKKSTVYLLALIGLVTIIGIALAFTDYPFWWYYNLGRSNSAYRFQPDFLVLLGGGGMPSESNLIRAYYTNQLAEKFPKAKVIIALPEDSSDESSSLKILRDYVIKNGVDSNRIFLENKGKNTRQQALNIWRSLEGISDLKVLIITSPEHMYRSVEVFKKAGFVKIGGEPCFEFALTANLEMNDEKEVEKIIKINVGRNTNLRYRFWNHLRYQILVAREKVAYWYYFIRGWV